MKQQLKFGITLLSAGLMAYSPVASANAMTLNEKIAFNNALKAEFRGTFGDLYARNSVLMDAPSKGFFEQWLANNGNQKLPQPQVQVVKDKNGNDSMKVILSHDGKTLTMIHSSSKPNVVNVNGKDVAIEDTRSAALMAKALADTDSSYRNLAKTLATQEQSNPRKLDRLSVNQLFQLTPEERVEYLMKVRQVIEASAEVVKAKQLAEVAANEQEPRNYVYDLLFSVHSAWAAAGIPVAGDGCVVAGNLSRYELVDAKQVRPDKNPKPGSKVMACNPFPVQFPQGFTPPKRFEDKCGNMTWNNKPFKGAPVACNPLVYGFNPKANGAAYCVDSGDQPAFRESATKQCNEASPLSKDSADLKKDYRRILESFAKGSKEAGITDEEISACFATGNDIHAKGKCEKIFNSQITAFNNFQGLAEKVCTENMDRATPDKKTACDALRSRTLALGNLLKEIANKRDPNVVVVPVPGENCTKAGLKPMPGTGLCYCADGKVAIDLGGTLDCPKDQAPLPPPKKQECSKDNKSGKDGKDEPKCSGFPWPLLAIPPLILLLLKGRNNDDKPTPTTLPVQMPNPVIGVKPDPGPKPGPGPGPGPGPNPGPTPTTPTTPPPPKPTVPQPPPPATEGGSGTRPSGAGGAGRPAPTPATK